MMSTRKLIVWKHDSPYGNVNAYKLFDLVVVKKLNEVPRKFADYEIVISDTKYDGVEMREVV